MAQVPAPDPSNRRLWFQRTRYEDGRWPLWRWDKNTRYILKSFLHRDTPWTREDRDHWVKNAAHNAAFSHRPGTRRWLAGGDWMWVRAGWSTAMSPRIRARLQAADASFFNLETPVDPTRPVPHRVFETLYYNAPPAYLDGWVTDAPCFASICNNHAMDQGLSGLVNTRQTVAARGLIPVGGESPEHAVGRATAGGQRIAAFGFTFGVNHPGTPAGVPIVNLGTTSPDALIALIQQAKRDADVVVAMAHWGYEYEYWPHTALRTAAYALIEAGVDVILGSSPHVLQPVELISVGGALPDAPVQLEGPRRTALIAWSLGNLCSIMPTLPCQVGALLELQLDDDGVCGVRALPTWCGRGVGAGRGWLDAGTVLLGELQDTELRTRAWNHASSLLGPFVEPL